MWRAATGRRRLLFCQKLGVQLPTLPTRQLRPCVRLSILETKLHGRSGIIKDAPRLLSVKSILLTKNRAWQPQDDATPSFLLKYQMLHPKEAANGARSDKNITFLSEIIVYFCPTWAGFPCTSQNWKSCRQVISCWLKTEQLMGFCLFYIICKISNFDVDV